MANAGLYRTHRYGWVMTMTRDRNAEIAQYVVENIDKALENGWIKVYYQPVARAISGALCGMEALSRWVDPERGLLEPESFVHALEQHRLIQKVDSFVIGEICRNYRRCINENIPVVPVSFNLSMLDFTLTDIGRVISEAVEEYEVPRSMLNIEITESMFMEDAARISTMIDRFHGSGYKVWMDDFGSGYSSLNVLKDFSFDELKIDMNFLSSFTQKSKDILQSTILMAKKIQIQTLAEGVETDEQLEFLRTIGCEKLQGYYYGKPAPYEQTLQSCLTKGMKVETRAWADYFDKVGKINFLTDTPLAILEDDGEAIRFLFANDAYRASLASNGTFSLKVAQRNINAPGTPMQHMFRKFAASLDEQGQWEELTYPSGDQYMMLKARIIARCNGHTMYEAHLSNITRNTEEEKKEVHDNLIRNVRYLYDLIALLDYGKDTVERFEVSVGGSNFGQSNLTYGVQEVLEQFSRDKILPDDRISFRSFMDTGTLAHRLLNHGEGFLSDYFRMKEEDGSYAWHVVNILLLPKMNNQRFLLLTKKAAIDEKTIRHKLINLYHKDYGMGQGNLQEGPDFSAQVMWKNLTDYSTIKYFWKDMDRRFVGVSRSFLEYYGLESQADVIGKTDEDMHWHVADGPYKSDEEEVLRKGLHTSNVPGKCIIKGVLHNILASKMPIYRNGKIVGLFGCFYDVENGADVGDPRGTTIDLATGLSNVRGIMDDLITYTEEYRSSGTDFAAVNINLGGYEDFRGEYGNELAEKLLHQVAEILLKNFGTTASLGRLMSGRFIALVKVPDQVSLGETLQELKYEIQSIIEVDGHRCSPFPRISKTYAGESVSPEQIMKRILDLCDPKTLG